MKRIEGIIPIIATTFRDGGAIDERGLRRIVRYVLEAGAHGVAYPAVASEFYALSEAERMHLSAVVIEEVGGMVPVVIATTGSSTPVAVDLSKHAQQVGADAIMLMAPYVVKENGDGIRQHFEMVANTVDLPIILQNAPAPLGTAQSPEAVLGLLRAVPQIRYVKEENLPGGQRITKLLNQAPKSLIGIFGGAGGRYIMDELNRGAIGAMPACELTELHVDLFKRHSCGDQAGAREFYNRSLPLLTFQAVFRMNMTKEILRRRGIIDSTHVRVGGVVLDEQDQQELSVLLAELEDLLLTPSIA